MYTSKEIKPSGWLKAQLKLEAEGLCGNLDRVWHDVRDSAWIGGNAEGWERVPYWLDGFVPLAYLLEDEDMIARAKRYIDAIVDAQQEDGWICPCSYDERAKYDTWAAMLIAKALTVYYECSDDDRIPPVIYNILKNLYDMLDDGEIELFNWGKFRWFETFISLNLIYDFYREPWIYEFAQILCEQGTDYTALVDEWKEPQSKWRLETHIVNLVMMLKSEAITHELLIKSYTDKAEELYEILEKYNGTAVGLFTGDECLSGISPIQGSELCSVVELMYSYEWLFAYSGERKWAERLEMLAFNALPAAISDDCWTHQYDQMANQIACKTFEGKPIFRTNHADANVFGLEPHFGCCTSNFGQGWPKLAIAAFMYRRGMIVNTVPVPCKLSDNGINIELETNYPFENKLTYHVDTDKSFELVVRIPDFAKNVKVNGEARENGGCVIHFNANEKAAAVVEFETVPEFIDRPNGLKTVKCGSLVFALPIEYETVMHEYVKDGVERKFPYCDYDLLPKSDWNYAYSSDEFEVERREAGEIPFSSKCPPVVIKTKARPIEWGYEEGYESVCARIPKSTASVGEEREVILYPYGCAKLRMTELPKI